MNVKCFKVKLQIVYASVERSALIHADYATSTDHVKYKHFLSLR